MIHLDLISPNYLEPLIERILLTDPSATMTHYSSGISGHNFDAFLNSQRGFNEYDLAAKIEEKYWRARQKFLAKIERKEDACIILSDAKLDAKLEVYRSIDKSCERLTDILESYQNCLYMYANEENSLGIILKEFSKHDKTKAGEIMSIVGKSFTESSHQRIKLYMPLVRLYQETETFHTKAVDDTSITVENLEDKRSQYRASLLWMKDNSEKLDPDVYGKLDKFRRIQNRVRTDKKAFDNVQMDVVQKIDLLMASRCNLLNQILGSYQEILQETFQRNVENFESILEILEKEDIYEYEFKTLKQLNPLQISEPTTPAEESAIASSQVLHELDLLDLDDSSEVIPDEDKEGQTEERKKSSEQKKKKPERQIDLINQLSNAPEFSAPDDLIDLGICDNNHNKVVSNDNNGSENVDRSSSPDLMQFLQIPSSSDTNI